MSTSRLGAGARQGSAGVRARPGGSNNDQGVAQMMAAAEVSGSKRRMMGAGAHGLQITATGGAG